MKKITRRLGLKTTTIRVLRDIELTIVQGGAGTGKPSNNPLGCVLAFDDGEKV